MGPDAHVQKAPVSEPQGTGDASASLQPGVGVGAGGGPEEVGKLSSHKGKHFASPGGHPLCVPSFPFTRLKAQVH